MLDINKTVVFDLDGTITPYKNGWQGEDVINEKPIKEMVELIDTLRSEGYYVIVVSTRCSTKKGKNVVEKYLHDKGVWVDGVMSSKPPALAYIDDRAINFNGNTKGLLEKIKSFKSWTEKGK